MNAVINFVVAGAVTGMLAGAVPAAAQYSPYGYPYGGYARSFPGYDQPYPGYGQSNPGYGQSYPGYGQSYARNYGADTQIAINRCADAVQARLDASAPGYAYSYGAGGGRVLGVSSVRPQGYGGALTVSGVASSGHNAPDAYGSPAFPDLTWQCTADYRGLVVGLSIQPAQRTYGNQGYRPGPYGDDDYSQYGYRRY